MSGESVKYSFRRWQFAAKCRMNFLRRETNTLHPCKLLINRGVIIGIGSSMFGPTMLNLSSKWFLFSSFLWKNRGWRPRFFHLIVLSYVQFSFKKVRRTPNDLSSIGKPNLISFVRIWFHRAAQAIGEYTPLQSFEPCALQRSAHPSRRTSAWSWSEVVKRFW